MLSSSTIRRLENVHFSGTLSRLIDDTYELSGVLKGTMILPDDITLEDYEYNFTSEIEEKNRRNKNKLSKKLLILQRIYGKIFLWRFLSRLLMKRIGI
ncbi:MAG: hypothetical protein L6V91_07910 [Bacilli bacterium]|nr:MAG: hypothetical protein L6V91_07910 [Bacilli bacterium]